ncbi:uncharacterized protein B0H18DRAFT_1130432 [Fomitopsis serialis]|uniref:uncharacterized protein n=1 Tax=Fomitopsis serialis TaxID=139415 RepID=UPI0020075025|nr:uncharacterized protein B0H18DRAFT_1130432 [Neoantrodia serialis]KAH9910267.1 hypothetical protein B0H18DRAFT_1130432 [Neoantrodia serialis]
MSLSVILNVDPRVDSRPPISASRESGPYGSTLRGGNDDSAGGQEIATTTGSMGTTTRGQKRAASASPEPSGADRPVKSPRMEQGSRMATPPPTPPQAAPSASSVRPRLCPRPLTTADRLELLWRHINVEVDQLDDRVRERLDELFDAVWSLKRQQNDINVINIATQAQAADNAVHMRELHELVNDIDNCETFMRDDVRKNEERTAKLEKEVDELKAMLKALRPPAGDDV